MNKYPQNIFPSVKPETETPRFLLLLLMTWAFKLSKIFAAKTSFVLEKKIVDEVMK